MGGKIVVMPGNYINLRGEALEFIRDTLGVTSVDADTVFQVSEIKVCENTFRVFLGYGHAGQFKMSDASPIPLKVVPKYVHELQNLSERYDKQMAMLLIK
jgi:hypothetical protein